jgi:phytoene dehydrogenase-like protein
MERYDVAVIGAGAEGLTAAALLARAGLRVIVLEKNATPGGRAVTREFHPGFRASPFADELAAIPQRLFWALDLARLGALLLPAPASVCISGTGTTLLYADDERLSRTLYSFALPAVLALRHESAALRAAIAAYSESTLPQPPSRLKFWELPVGGLWPGEELGQLTLADALAARVNDSALRLHIAAEMLAGRAVSPFLAGTALHLLGGAGSGMAVGGLGALGQALVRAVQGAGGQIRCLANVSDVRLSKRRLGRSRAVSVRLENEEITARAVLSTLDAKKTFLSLFDWKTLPRAQVKQAAQFRVRGQSARVLFALDAPPQFPFAREAPDAARGPIHVVSSLESMSQAYDSWRAGTLPEQVPVSLRVPSLADPRLAPAGKAVMTATLSAIPARLFDGPWTPDKRALLVKTALAAADAAAPGTSEHVLASHVIVAPDIEEALGLTEGDLDGGELSPDQAFSFRPWPGMDGGRTPIAGFYLAGSSAPPSSYLTGASGQRAALTILSDLKNGRLP